MKKASGAFAAVAGLLLLAGCGRDKVAGTYPNGKPKLIRTYGIFGGAAPGNLRREQSFYFNEHKESDSHWKDGKLDGPYEDYWHNGQKKSQGRYRAGKKEGEWDFYYNQFTLSSKGNYKDDQKDGPWDSFWENGALKSQGAFSAGQEVGAWKEWTAKGEVAAVNSCFASNDTGRYVSYHANNTVKEEYACKRGVPDGEYLKKDPDGAVVERGHFDAQGRKDGVWETFWAEGRTASRRSYAAGLEQDSGWAWDEAGRLKERSRFDSGSGERVLYDSLGHLVQKTRYLKGQPDGEDWSYWPEGAAPEGRGAAPAARGAGAKGGVADKPGPKRQLIVYAAGKPVTMRKWHLNGKPMAEGQFEDGHRAGEWRDWWDDGTLKEISHFQGGALHGDRLFYDQKGKLIRTSRYEHGYPAEGRVPKAVLKGGLTGDSGIVLRPQGK
jgi:antitoxin component YwqK of YwqJK toxin-antitoxin module